MFIHMSQTKLVPLAVLAITLIARDCLAQSTSQAAAGPRPRIGLVLGGGGAKGAAHVGVLQVLDELRVPIDCVAGTSMGALVGATFAAGSAPAEIERAVLAIDWAQTVGGQGRRDQMPINRKLAEQTNANPLELGIGSGGIRVPRGLIATQRIENEIRGLVAHARFTHDFDELPIPFRAVATDMLGGGMVILGEGDLSVAMRASMAIPGAFAPVVLGNQVLADGGMMRNLPVDVARDLCADVVIAVWLTSPPLEQQDVASALALAGRSLDVMIQANQNAQIATLTIDDVGVAVPMGDIGSSDFHRVPETIALGRTAAEVHRDALLRYSIPETEYLAWRESLARPAFDTNRIAAVQITGTGRVNEEYVRAQLRRTLEGASVTANDVAVDAERIFATGAFERVEYRLTGSPEEREIEFETVEKSWGPNFMRFDFGLANLGDPDLIGIVRVDHNRPWTNSLGGEWHNAMQLGRWALLTTDWYQPLDTRQRFFVQPIAQMERERQDIYLDGDRVAQYLVSQVFGQADLGLNLGTKAQLRLGFRHGTYEADIDTGIPGLPEIDSREDTSLQFRAAYDTRDSVGLPTRGTFLNVRYVYSSDWLDGEERYELLEGVIQHAFNIGGNALNLIAGGANTLSGELPVTQQIQLGGIRTFPGLRPGELRGNGYWFAGTIYSWRLLDIQPLFGQSIYAGIRLQAGEVTDRIDQVDDGTLYGLSGSLTGRTPVGTLLLSLGFVDNGSWLLQFSLGRKVPEGSSLDDIH
jgi:NTE family protein